MSTFPFFKSMHIAVFFCPSTLVFMFVFGGGCHFFLCDIIFSYSSNEQVLIVCAFFLRPVAAAGLFPQLWHYF